MATGTSVGSFLGDSMKWRLEYCFISAGFLQSSAIVSFENSKAVSPPASLADATYFWCGKSRQNRSCREGARQTAPGALRFSHRTAGSKLAPLLSLRHAEPETPVRCCDTRRHRGRGVAAERSVHVVGSDPARHVPAPRRRCRRALQGGPEKGPPHV